MILQHRERNWAVFGGARPGLKLKCFWKASSHPHEKLTQHRDLSWTVFGGARPAVHLNVVESLHNIKTKRYLTARNELGRDSGCWGARPSHQFECFWNGCITSRLRGFSTPWKELGRVWGSTTQPKSGMFLKSFTPSGRKLDSTPWIELDRVWGTTTNRSFERCWKTAQHQKKKYLTPRNELGRDKGCWGARPSHQLDCFWNGCMTSWRRVFVTPWIVMGRVWGSTIQPKFRMFLKGFIPSGQKVDSTPWIELDLVWGSNPSRSFERCWKSA